MAVDFMDIFEVLVC